MNFSLLGKLMWLPLFVAPFKYTLLRIWVPATVVGLAVGLVAGQAAGIKTALMTWVICGWIASFAYKG